MRPKPPARNKTAPRGPRKDSPPARAPQPEAKQGPPDQTFQEAQYLKTLVADKTPVRVKLQDNDEVQGVVEYYDANFIRLTRKGEPNLFIYKRDIKYLEE